MSEHSHHESVTCPGCGEEGDEITYEDGAYSCPNFECDVVAFGSGDMVGVA